MAYSKQIRNSERLDAALGGAITACAASIEAEAQNIVCDTGTLTRVEAELKRTWPAAPPKQLRAWFAALRAAHVQEAEGSGMAAKAAWQAEAQARNNLAMTAEAQAALAAPVEAAARTPPEPTGFSHEFMTPAQLAATKAQGL